MGLEISTNEVTLGGSKDEECVILTFVNEEYDGNKQFTIHILKDSQPEDFTLQFRQQNITVFTDSMLACSSLCIIGIIVRTDLFVN